MTRLTRWTRRNAWWLIVTGYLIGMSATLIVAMEGAL